METSTNRRSTLQSHQLQAKHQKQKQRHHQQRKEDHSHQIMPGSAATMCSNSCRYYYDSSSPTFPDLSPPRDMPQPHKQNMFRKPPLQQPQTLPHQQHMHQQQHLQLQQQQQQKPQHQQQPQFPDDPDSIEFCLDEEPAAAARYYKDSRSTGARHKTYDPQVRWSRNNIAVTMERFQPIASPSSPSESSSCASHQDYSYAYYEPGAIMCHSNIPTPEEVAGPSVLPPPNSMRALLLKTKEKTHKTLPAANRHTYTTRYGTHENIYEDVSDEKHSRLVSSEQSLTERGCTKKEFQHILNNHYRVLEELNLSVEELLMSSSPPSEPTPPPAVIIKRSSAAPSSVVDAISTHLSAIDLKDDMRSPVSELVMGEDSGFSGSSSGASYIGSLRNYKTAITRSLRRSSAPNCSGGSGGGGSSTSSSSGTIYGSCRTAKFPHDLRQGSFYNTTKVKDGGGSCSGSSNKSCSPEAGHKSSKFALWNKRS